MSEPRMLGRTPNEILLKLGSPSQSIDKIMEDVQLMLGLSQEEIAYLLSLLQKTDFGSLHFFRGATNIRFDKILPQGKHSKIKLKVKIGDGDIERTREYNVPRAFILSVIKCINKQFKPNYQRKAC